VVVNLVKPRLVLRCQPMLDALDESVDELARIARGMEGQVSIGCIASVSYALLAPVIASFRGAPEPAHQHEGGW
jgi:DNA-binding transcriptional LysR family regulator